MKKVLGIAILIATMILLVGCFKEEKVEVKVVNYHMETVFENNKTEDYYYLVVERLDSGLQYYLFTDFKPSFFAYTLEKEYPLGTQFLVNIKNLKEKDKE